MRFTIVAVALSALSVASAQVCFIQLPIYHMPFYYTIRETNKNPQSRPLAPHLPLLPALSPPPAALPSPTVLVPSLSPSWVSPVLLPLLFSKHLAQKMNLYIHAFQYDQAC